MHPSDIRVANALKIIAALRDAGRSTNADVARAIGLSIPAVHRLMSELMEQGLVEESEVMPETVMVGRPATAYRFREDAALLCGVDIGNGTTRIVLTDLGFRDRASLSFPTAELGEDLGPVLASSILQLCEQQEDLRAPLIGVGIGVPASVDPRTGIMHNLPVLHRYEGLCLAEEMAEALGRPVAVQQDDHYSALAENSPFGSRQDADSLLVLEIGWGIGVGYCLNGQPVSGFRGSFGRIAGWPVSTVNDWLVGETLGDVLTTGGLLDQYQKRGGHFPITDGLGLVDAARGGEQQAIDVLDWAGQEISQTVLRLALLCDPEAVVFGGGLSRAFDLFEPIFTRSLPTRLVPVPSVLKDRAVVVGAALEVNRFVEEWFASRLLRG